MAEFDEQRKRVEELKRKILEQKKGGGETLPSDVPASNPLNKSQEQMGRTGLPEAAHRHVNTEAQVTGKEETHKSEPDLHQKNEPEKMNRPGEKSSHGSETIPMVSLQAYAQALKQAWSNGSVSDDEKSLLLTLRKSMGISDEVHQSLEQDIRFEIYYSALVDCWKDGSLTPQDLDTLELLREKFHISAEEHLRMEKQARQEIGKH